MRAGAVDRDAAGGFLAEARENPMRRFIITAAVLGMLGLFAPAVSAQSAYCGITGGSLPKVSERLTPTPITAVRAGQHACFDRFVVEVAGGAPGYRVRYVGAVAAQGSGDPIPLRGGAFFDVTVLAPANDANGQVTYVPANPREVVPVGGYSTFRQVAWGGSYEGYTTFGLGVRARLPFRVFTLAGPGSHSRLVVDVAHRW